MKFEPRENPLSIFYKADPSVLGFLAEILTPREFKVVLELLCGMDVANLFEADHRQTPRQYMEIRFCLAKSDVNKILKRLRELGIIACSENPANTLRVNPWIANKSKHLSGYWEFEDIKLKPLIDAGYHDWLVDKGLMAANTLSRKRIKLAPNTKKTASLVERTLRSEISQLIHEHTKDYENYLAERKEYEMLIQTMQKQHQENVERFERLILENERQHAQTRKEIADFFAILMKKSNVPDDVKIEARRTMFKVLDGGRT